MVYVFLPNRYRHFGSSHWSIYVYGCHPPTHVTLFGCTGIYWHVVHPAISTWLWNNHPLHLCRRLDEQLSNHINHPHSLPVLIKISSVLSAIASGLFHMVVGTQILGHFQSSVGRVFDYYSVFNRLCNMILSRDIETCTLMYQASSQTFHLVNIETIFFIWSYSLCRSPFTVIFKIKVWFRFCGCDSVCFYFK